jgi:hypothetical protein
LLKRMSRRQRANAKPANRRRDKSVKHNGGRHTVETSVKPLTKDQLIAESEQDLLDPEEPVNLELEQIEYDPVDDVAEYLQLRRSEEEGDTHHEWCGFQAHIAA